MRTLSLGKSPTEPRSVLHSTLVSTVKSQFNTLRLVRTNQPCPEGKTLPPILLHCCISSVCDAVECIPEVVCDKVSSASPFPLSLPHLCLLHFCISQNAFQEWGVSLLPSVSEGFLWADKLLLYIVVNTGVCLWPGPCSKCQLHSGCIALWSSEATVGGGRGICFSSVMGFFLYDCQISVHR